MWGVDLTLHALSRRLPDSIGPCVSGVGKVLEGAVKSPRALLTTLTSTVEHVRTRWYHTSGEYEPPDHRRVQQLAHVGPAGPVPNMCFLLPSSYWSLTWQVCGKAQCTLWLWCPRLGPSVVMCPTCDVPHL